MDGAIMNGRHVSVERVKPQKEKPVFHKGRPGGWSDMDTDEEYEYLSSL